MGNVFSRPTDEVDTEKEQTIAHKLKVHRDVVFKCLPVDLSTFVRKGIELGLLDITELDFYLNQSIPRDNKIHEILHSVEGKASGYSKFLECMRKMKDHMGHQYIVSVIENELFAEISDIEESAIIHSQILKNMSKLEDINLKELCPLLLQKKLITFDEFTQLTDNTCLSESERNLLLFHILETKGPTAHLLFVQCLGEEESHICHKDLYQLFYSDLKSHSRKRGQSECVFKSPEKRCPQHLVMQGVLRTERYAQSVRNWRKWVSNGQWDHTDSTEHKYMDKEFVCSIAETVANLLQGVIARIVRKKYREAETLLKKCDDLCHDICGDNNTILRGRCKYTWSWLFRYLKQHHKAKEFAREAMQILFNVSPGEDKTLANYGYACSLIECQATARFPNPEEMKTAEESLRFAIGCATIEDRGLDHIPPHSHLRLAQMYLGSTHYEPGKNTDKDSLRQASDCLKAVDLSSIPPRSRCIFFLTESDLYRCKGNTTLARESAKHALEIAQESSFETEIVAAKTKLEFLQ